MEESESELQRLRAAIASLEAQRSSLGNAVTESAVAALRAQLAQLEAQTPRLAGADERKIVTIVFADISGFTALSEKLDPEEVRQLINACFDRLVPVVRKYEGTIDKFIGDEIMALFGAPVAHEDDAERALRAALEMMDTLAQFNRDQGTELGMHIGVNTGRVLAGVVGAGGHRDYSVTGDAVNLAARLEGASETGEIFVGANTYRATTNLFNFQPVPPLTLKGKEAPVEVYRLLSAKARRVRPRGIEGIRAPLIGREAELALVRETIRDLASGTGRLVSIAGDAGLGKSRLIGEVRASAPHNVVWIEGRALSYTTGRSYWLARDLIRNAINVSADDPPDIVGQTLRSDLNDYFGEAITEYYPYLARLLELPLDAASEERIQFLSGEALQARISGAFADYFRVRAGRQSLVLVWEDLHWCDPSSLQLLDHIAGVVTGAPLLLLCTARNEQSRPLRLLETIQTRYPNHSLRIELNPLDREKSNELVKRLLNIEDVSPEVRDLMIKRAEGNPFYIEELLRSLLDTGAFVLTAERAKFQRNFASIDVPETLEEVLSARIDRLKPEHKATLQRASVIGRIFDRAVLARLDPGIGQGELDGALAELRQRQFIQVAEANDEETSGLQENELIFKHAITHEVAYGSLLRAKRRELHAATARALEELFPHRIDELAAVLGQHYERAEVAESAAFHLGRAAERAQATFANEEAIEWYRSAIRAIGRVLLENETVEVRERAARLNESVGDLLTLAGQHDDARAALRRALDFIGVNDVVGRARVYRKIGFSHSLQRDFSATEEAFQTADRQLEEGSVECDTTWGHEKVQIQLERLHLFYWQGMTREMNELADRYSSMVRECGSLVQRGKFFSMLALSQLSASDFRPSAECEKLAEIAVSESESSPALAEAAHIRFTLGLIKVFRGHFEEALVHLGAALEVAERIGDRVTQARCLSYSAVAHRCLHHVEQARFFAERTRKLGESLRMVEYMAMAEANLAWVAWSESDRANVERRGREALKLWHGMDDPYGFDWMALWPLIAAALAEHQTAHAVELALGLFAETQHPLPEELMSATREAIELWKRGDATGSQLQMEKALQIAEHHRYI